jgi:hypothetical protein
VIASGNGEVAQATQGGNAVDSLTRIAQAQTVAQGTASDALESGTQQNNLSQTVQDYTGANMTQAVDQASVGVVVPARLEIVATDAVKTEGDSGTTLFTFTVNRSGNLSGEVSADYTVSGANGLDGDDFGGTLPGGTVTFASGETSRTITIAVRGDTGIEDNENFTVTLSNATGNTALATAQAAGTILNEDPVAPMSRLPTAPTVVAGTATAIEGVSILDGDSAAVTVTLTVTGGVAAVTGPATIATEGNVIRVSGSVANVNATLGTLTFTGGAGETAGSIRIDTADGDATTTDASSMLAIAIVSAPENTLPTRPTVVAGVSTEVIGIGVADTDSATLTVTLTPSGGTVSVTSFGSVAVTDPGGGKLQITGLAADVNNTLASLEFTANSGVKLGSITIDTSDGDSLTADDSDVLYLDVVSGPENTVRPRRSWLPGWFRPSPVSRSMTSIPTGYRSPSPRPAA